MAALVESLKIGIAAFLIAEVGADKREKVMRQVALEYNWRHPHRKVSWRRLNRRQRAEVKNRLIAEVWERRTEWHEYWGIE